MATCWNPVSKYSYFIIFFPWNLAPFVHFWHKNLLYNWRWICFWLPSAEKLPGKYIYISTERLLVRPTKWKFCKCISIDMVETWWYWHRLGFKVKKWRPKFPTDFGLNQGLLFLFLKHESSCRVKACGVEFTQHKIVAVFFIKGFSHDIRWVWQGEKIDGRLFGKSGLYIKEKGKEKPRLLFLHFLALLGFSKSTRYHLDDFFFLLFSNVDLSYCWCNRAATILSLNPNNFSPTHSFSDYISNARFHNKCVQFALCSPCVVLIGYDSASLLFLQSSLVVFFPTRPLLHWNQ